MSMERIYDRDDGVEFLSDVRVEWELSVHIWGCILTSSNYRGWFSSKLRWSWWVAIFDWDRSDTLNWLSTHLPKIISN